MFSFKIQKLDFLIALYMFCIIVSETMGGKTFPVMKLGSFQLNSSVAIFLIPIVFTINDVITEVYGKERTRSIIRSGLVIIAFVFLFSLFATSLPPSQRSQATESAYDTIFHTSARFSFASLVAFAISEFTDVFIFSKIRERLGKKRLWLRNNLSNFIAQFVDTTVFYILAFYVFDKSFTQNMTFIFSLVPVYWLLKCCMSIIETPFVYLGVRWLQTEKKK